MKKLKAFLLGFVLCMAVPLAAEDFEWSKFWTNYGGGIEKGDVLLSLETSLLFNESNFHIPWIYADLQFPCLIGGKVPFTFGCYIDANFDDFDLCFLTGGSAMYHVMVPLKPLDLYAGFRFGALITYSFEGKRFVSPVITYDINIGASWFFTDFFGLNLELGTAPIDIKFGAIFKF